MTIRSSWIPAGALYVCDRLYVQGKEAVLVGGCVRDALLGRTPHDWDVATNATPEEVLRLFTHTIPTGIKHGTVTVLPGRSGYDPIEVTTYRTEGKYSDGRHPDEVKFGVSLEEDLARRDFTMNAIAYNPASDRLVDPFGGATDLRHHLIRAVRDPHERFREDGLRPLRALRFAATLEMELEEGTRKAIRNTLGQLRRVAGERVREELLKLLAARRPSIGLDLAMRTGLLGDFIPELLDSWEFPQNHYHRHSVWEHTLVVVDHALPDPIHRVGALLHDVGKPASAKPAYGPGEFSFVGHERLGAEMAKEITARLRFSKAEQERIVGMVRYHMALFGYDKGMGKKGLRRAVSKLGNLLPDVVALSKADIIGKGTGEDPEERFAGVEERLWAVMSEIARGETPVATGQLAINGHDVMQALNTPPGALVGEALRWLLEQVLDEPELNTREALLQLLQRFRRKGTKGARDSGSPG